MPRAFSAAAMARPSPRQPTVYPSRRAVAGSKHVFVRATLSREGGHVGGLARRTRQCDIPMRAGRPHEFWKLGGTLNGVETTEQRAHA